MEDVQAKGLLRRVQSVLAEISIEPILFLYYVGLYIRMVVRENLKLDRFCRITLGYDEADCAVLNDGHHEKIQIETQKLDSVFNFYEKVASTLVPILLMFFLASWSDKQGRKVLLILCFVGESMYNIIYLLESLFTSWPPQVLLLASFLQSIGGGMVMLLMAAYSFMADKTSQSSRTFRMMMMNSIMHLGGPIGTALGAWLFAVKGYVLVFSVSLICSVICLVLVVLIIKEKPKSESDDSKMQRSPWNPRNVLDLFRACFRRRPGRGRIHLILLITFMLGLVSAIPHNLYLWCRRVFLWDENQYSLYSTINQVSEQVASLIIAPIVHRIGFHDCVTGAVASFPIFLKALSMGLTTSPSQWWVVYIFIIVPNALPSAAIRAMMSKICDADEVGRVFSLLAILEVIWPLADSALFTLIYTSTLDFYPSYEHIVGAVFAAYAFTGLLGLRLSFEQEKTCDLEAAVEPEKQGDGEKV